MSEYEWLFCPVCKSKTRDRIRGDTVLVNFPLFCPKCKQETVINVQELIVTVINAPDAKPQSR
jgi:ribosomal protein L44E